jgi:2-isopropylmalate synthase
MGKHSGRAALRAKLKELGFELADNQLNDVFVRFKALADRKKEVYDDDLVALMRRPGDRAPSGPIQVKFLRVVCGTEGPQIGRPGRCRSTGRDRATAQGDGPVDATFNAVKRSSRTRRGCSSTRCMR